MQKLYATLLLITAPCAFTQAQITIGQAEMPHASDQLVRVKAVTNPFVNYAATGAAHNWDFSGLSAAQGDTVRYQTVASTNFVYAIVYADIFFNSNRANTAKPGVDIPFSNLLPIANPYTFSYLSGSQFKTVGMGAEMSGIPLPIIFDEHDVIYQLPLQFGASSSSHSSYHVDIPNVGYYGFQQDRANTVDGWGAITTPGGSWDVLRVKTTLTAKDSVGGFAINRPVTREYKWLAQGLRVPVLQINTTALFGAEVVTGIWYYDVPRTLTVEAPLAESLCPGATFNVHFNATGSYNAGGIFIPANQFRVQLSDAAGSFAAPVNIGSLQGTTSGFITATIPANTPPGSGYKVRVVSTSPAYTGAVPSMTISVGGPASASISAAGPTQLCAGDSLLLTAVGGPGYQWYHDGMLVDGATGEDLLVTQAGSYTVMVSNDCGQATSTAVDVAVHDAPSVQAENASAILCANGTVGLTAVDLGGQTGNTYQWFLNNAPIAGATDLSYQAAMAGQYELQATDTISGCTGSTGPVQVTLETMPVTTLQANGASSFCTGGSVELNAANGQASTYAWALNGQPLGDVQGGQYMASEAGTYSVVAVSAHGCSADPVQIDIAEDPLPPAPLLTAGGSTTVCLGDSVDISATFEGVLVNWYLDGNLLAGVSGNEWFIAQSGAVTATTTSEAGCTSAPSEALVILVSPLPEEPVLSASGPLAICPGNSVELHVSTQSGMDVQWFVDGQLVIGATGQSLITDTPGTYTVVATNGSGCGTASDASLIVEVLEAPAVPIIAQVDEDLVTTGTGEFQWYLNGQLIVDATESTYTPAVSGSYTVTVTNAAGCSSTSVPFVFVHTGIDHLETAVLRLQPNPNKGRFTLDVPQQTGQRFEVCDLSGKTLRSGDLRPGRNAIDLGSLAEGVYFLRATNASGESKVLRFVVQ